MTSLKAGPTGGIKQLQKCKPQPGRTWEDTHGIQSLPTGILSCALPWETAHGRGWEQHLAPRVLRPGPGFLSSSHKSSPGGGRDLGEQHQDRDVTAAGWGQERPRSVPGWGQEQRSPCSPPQAWARGTAWAHLWGSWVLPGRVSPASRALVCCCESGVNVLRQHEGRGDRGKRVLNVNKKKYIVQINRIDGLSQAVCAGNCWNACLLQALCGTAGARAPFPAPCLGC